jgi:very-short-patch-repair endonuclease
MKKYGPDLLLQQIVDHIAGDFGWRLGESAGDSPIERLLFHAFIMRSECGATEYDQVRVAKDAHQVQKLMDLDREQSDPGSSLLIVWPQATFDGRIVDFMIFCLDWRNAKSVATWRRLVVECDGHHFHNKTKEQVSRDRKKDRRATLNGVDFFRFTGSEIWRDPWGCAEQITDWAVKGFG